MVMRVRGEGMLERGPNELGAFRICGHSRRAALLLRRIVTPLYGLGRLEGTNVSPGLATETGANIGVAVSSRPRRLIRSNGA